MERVQGLVNPLYARSLRGSGDIGSWNDGVAVKEPVVTVAPEGYILGRKGGTSAASRPWETYATVTAPTLRSMRRPA